MVNNSNFMFWVKNKGKIIGLIIGFIIGLLVLFIGILKTIVILIFALIGLYLGHLWDGGNGIQNIYKKIFKK